MKYVEIERINKQEFLAKEPTANSEQLSLMLYGISEIDDWEWVQEIYCKYLNHTERWVVIAAIKGLADIARISHNLNKDKIINMLKRTAEKNNDLKDIIEDAIDDIELFVKSSKHSLESMIEVISYESVNGLKFGESKEEALQIFASPNSESINDDGSFSLIYEKYSIIFDINSKFSEFTISPQTKATINGVEVKWTLKEMLDVIYLDSDPRMDDDGIILYDLGIYLYAFDSSDDDDFSDKTIDFFARGTMDEWKENSKPFDLEAIKRNIKEKHLNIKL